MKQHFKSLGLTFVTAGIFFGILLGGQYLLRTYYVADHFQGKLAKINGVENVEVVDQKITITLKQVANLKQSYGEITRVVNDEKYEISIKDFPSPELEEIAEESEIALQEGVARGNFTAMSQYIRNLAQSKGVGVKIFIDTERVYLQLEEENKFIYRIIERPDHGLPVIA